MPSTTQWKADPPIATPQGRLVIGWAVAVHLGACVFGCLKWLEDPVRLGVWMGIPGLGTNAMGGPANYSIAMLWSLRTLTGAVLHVPIPPPPALLMQVPSGGLSGGRGGCG